MRRSRALGALVGVILATPVALWCLMGDRSEPDGYLRLLEPPVIDRGLELAIGVAAAGVVLAGLAVVATASYDGVLGRADRRATIPLVLAGVFLAVGGRIVTSATYGANIGGGGLVLVAPWVLPPLLIIGVVRWWRILRSLSRAGS